jgi:hypothetical protein
MAAVETNPAASGPTAEVQWLEMSSAKLPFTSKSRHRHRVPINLDPSLCKRCVLPGLMGER